MKKANKNVLEDFASKHKDAINAVNRWVDIIENNEFKNHNQLKLFFPIVDYIGNSRYVFNNRGINIGSLYWLFL